MLNFTLARERQKGENDGMTKESNPVEYITRNYLDCTLKETLSPYVTKDYLDKKLEEMEDMFDEKLAPYVTKDYLEEVLDERFETQHRRIMVLFEFQNDKLQLMVESIAMRFESHERKIDALEVRVF